MTRGWLSVPEAALALGMSPQTLWRRVRQRCVDLPTVDGRLVVPLAHLEVLRTDPNVAARPYRTRKAPQ